MTMLTIDLPAEIYDQLATTAQQQQKPVEVLAREWLAERSATQKNQRERTLGALREAGLLAAPSAEARHNRPLTIAERARLAAQVAPGRSLADIIIEDRGQA